MSARAHEELDAFLSELDALDGLVTELPPGVPSASELGLRAVSESLPPLTAAADARARLFAELDTAPRFERFAPQVAEMLDVSLDTAREMLTRIDDPKAWSQELPGIAFLWLEGGPKVAQAVRGFVRVDAGAEFPQHEHLGVERVLVMQGGFEDHERGRVFRAGDSDRMEQGTSHSFRVLPDGVALLKLAVIQNGLCALGQQYLPR